MNTCEDSEKNDPLKDMVEEIISELSPERRETLRKIAWKQGYSLEGYIAKTVSDCLTPGTVEYKEINWLNNTFSGNALMLIYKTINMVKKAFKWLKKRLIK